VSNGTVSKGVLSRLYNARCLGGTRFKVETAFETSQGVQGVGQAVALTTDTGYFWFFDQANVEVVLKVLDGCGVNGKYWVFAAGLTNTEVTLTVTDTASGTAKVYVNPQGRSFQSVQDTNAFATCE
jgi:hypothetical protein